VLDFPYYYCVNNGAVIYLMPQATVESKQYLSSKIFVDIDSICHANETDYILYMGLQNDDICYYRPHLLSPEIVRHLKKRSAINGERMIAVEAYDEEMFGDGFASVKCFGPLALIEKLAEQMRLKLNLHVPVISDPFSKEIAIAQATHPLVSKGGAVSKLKELLGKSLPVIAAGDDRNDISMLKKADVSIVMANAPADVLEHARIVAPSAGEDGLVTGLNQAISLLEGESVR